MTNRIILKSNGKSEQFPLSLVWTEIDGHAKLKFTTPAESFIAEFSKNQERNDWYKEINKQTIETINKENNVEEDEVDAVPSSEAPTSRTGQRWRREF